MKRTIELPFSVGDVVSRTEEYNDHDAGQAVRVTHTEYYLIVLLSITPDGVGEYYGFPVGVAHGEDVYLGDVREGFTLAWEWPGRNEQRTRAVVGLSTADPPDYGLSQWLPDDRHPTPRREPRE